jgi:hypothetical protein
MRFGASLHWNVIFAIHLVGHTDEWATKTPKHQNASTRLPLTMPQPTQAQSSNQEDRLLLAIQALKEHQFKSVRAAALSYDVPRTTLSSRMNGMTSRRDSTPNLQKLTPYEESALVRYILDLDSRGFPPRPQGVQEMADLLLSERGESPVGINWTTTFIKRRTLQRWSQAQKQRAVRRLYNQGIESGCQSSKASIRTDGHSRRSSFSRRRITSLLGTRTQDCQTIG